MSWLSDGDIKRKIRLNGDSATQKAFLGVFPIDDLPFSLPSYPAIFVVNTQSHNLPGEHWIAIFIDQQRRGEVFDSLALPPSLLLTQWMNRFCRSWRRNHFSYQHPFSAACGSFVIYFVLHRLRVSHLNDITNCFTRELYANEKFIVSFYDALK